MKTRTHILERHQDEAGLRQKVRLTYDTDHETEVLVRKADAGIWLRISHGAGLGGSITLSPEEAAHLARILLSASDHEVAA